MAHIGIINALGALETTNGALRFPEIANGRLLGRELVENSDMDGVIDPAATENNFCLLYGDFREFIIADRVGSSLEIIANIVGANNRPTGERGAILWYRTGSNVTSVSPFRLLDVPTTAWLIDPLEAGVPSPPRWPASGSIHGGHAGVGGLVDPDMTSKRCRRCGIEKPAADFPRSPRMRDGLRSWCKPCANERTRQWRAEKRAERDTAWAKMERDAERATRQLQDWTAQRLHAIRQAVEDHDRLGP